MAVSKQRCVVVTGGDSGIGAACAIAFAEGGDRVAIFYHSDAASAAQVAAQAGAEAMAVQCSVDDEASVEKAFDEVERKWGPSTVLVNSAGINMSGQTVRDMSAAAWKRMLATDLTGAFLVSRRFLKGLGNGKPPAAMVHISSIHAEAVRAGGADYCSAKAGLNNLVRTLAVEEAANGVRINAIEPGMILTPMNQRAMEDVAYRQSLETNIPMGRAGTAEEIASIARWLASDEASYMTGAVVVADGGLSLLQGLGA
jgi:glucose 1-dehydrogenase